VSKRYNVLFPREYMDSKGEKRTDFIRVGVAFELKNQDGFTVELYMNPPSRKLVVMPVREKENTQGDAFEDYGGFGGPYEP
jgi:hypothetical protein